MTEDPPLDILLPAAGALLMAGSDEEKAAMQDRLHLMLALVAQRIMDEEVRVRWFRSPVGRELTKLAGALETSVRMPKVAQQQGISLDDIETKLLQLLAEGRTNREIAEEFVSTEESVAQQLAGLFAKIGASSRGDATAVAMMTELG
jgi:DNA-binding NarL/FixJ family response regulator